MSTTPSQLDRQSMSDLTAARPPNTPGSLGTFEILNLQLTLSTDFLHFSSSHSSTFLHIDFTSFSLSPIYFHYLSPYLCLALFPSPAHISLSPPPSPQLLLDDAIMQGVWQTQRLAVQLHPERSGSSTVLRPLSQRSGAQAQQRSRVWGSL